MDTKESCAWADLTDGRLVHAALTFWVQTTARHRSPALFCLHCIFAIGTNCLPLPIFSQGFDFLPKFGGAENPVPQRKAGRLKIICVSPGRSPALRVKIYRVPSGPAQFSQRRRGPLVAKEAAKNRETQIPRGPKPTRNDKNKGVEWRT